MDGLHKLKTPGLYASLFLQASSIYLLFQATNLRSHSYLQEGLTRRSQRDIPMEGPNRAQELQCSEGLAAYQWGAIGCMLLSMGSLTPMFMRRREQQEAGFYSKAAETPTALPREPDPALAAEGAWIKEPAFNGAASRPAQTRDNVYRAPRDNIYRNPTVDSSMTQDGRAQEPRAASDARLTPEGLWKDPRAAKAAASEGAWKDPRAAKPPVTEGAWKDPRAASESRLTSEGLWKDPRAAKAAASEGAWKDPRAVNPPINEGAWKDPGAVNPPIYEGGWKDPRSAKAALGDSAWKDPRAVNPRLNDNAWKDPRAVNPRLNDNAWKDPRAVNPPLTDAWKDPRAVNPPLADAWKDPRSVNPPVNDSGWKDPRAAKASASEGGWKDPRGGTKASMSEGGWKDPRAARAASEEGGWKDPRATRTGADDSAWKSSSEGAWKDPRSSKTADNAWKDPRATSSGDAWAGTDGSEGAWMKRSDSTSYTAEGTRGEMAYQSEGAWMKDARRNESAYLSETHRSETYHGDMTLRSETHRSEAAYRSDGQSREGAYRTEAWRTDTAITPTAMEGGEASAYKSLKKGIEELELCLKNQPAAMSDGNLIRTVTENVRLLETRNRSTYESLVAGHEEIQKATSRLQRLMEQCRDSANYSATNRVDWKKNKLIDILTQMRQNLDMVVDLSKNINSIHSSTLRMLGESLHSESILNEKITRAQEQLERIQANAHVGTKAHDTMITIIGESRDNITGASKFVGSLGQKWDAIVHMTEELDEVAEKINAQTLTASREMVRGASSQNVTDLFPLGTELRGLAATFHTYARQVKDAINDVRDEMVKTNSYLSQAGAKADLAVVSVGQSAEYYRGSVNAVKHSASELVLLQHEVNIHMKKLHDTRAMGQNSAELLGTLDRHLQGHNGYGMKIMEETSQITVHSEKISTLLAKQYHELNHSQKILASSSPLLSDSIRFTMETTQTISTLAGCLNRVPTHEDGSALDHAGRTDEVIIAKIENFKQLIASMKEPLVAHPALEASSAQSSVMKQRTLAVQQPRTPATWRVMN